MTFLLSTAASSTSLSAVIHSVVITAADKALFNGLLVSAPCGDISHCSALKCHVHEDTIHQQVIFTTTAEVEAVRFNSKQVRDHIKKDYGP